MLNCKRPLVITRQSADTLAHLAARLAAGELEPYTGTIAQQAALTGFFQEFEVVTDEELAVLVVRPSAVGDTTEGLSFIFLLKADYTQLLAQTRLR